MSYSPLPSMKLKLTAAQAIAQEHIEKVGSKAAKRGGAKNELDPNLVPTNRNCAHQTHAGFHALHTQTSSL